MESNLSKPDFNSSSSEDKLHNSVSAIECRIEEDSNNFFSAGKDNCLGIQSNISISSKFEELDSDGELISDVGFLSDSICTKSDQPHFFAEHIGDNSLNGPIFDGENDQNFSGLSNLSLSENYKVKVDDRINLCGSIQSDPSGWSRSDIKNDLVGLSPNNNPGLQGLTSHNFCQRDYFENTGKFLDFKYQANDKQSFVTGSCEEPSLANIQDHEHFSGAEVYTHEIDKFSVGASEIHNNCLNKTNTTALFGNNPDKYHTVEGLMSNASLGYKSDSTIDSDFTTKRNSLYSGIDFDRISNLSGHISAVDGTLFQVDSKGFKQNDVKSYNYDEMLIEELSKIDSRLTKIYKGAVEINYNKTSDYKRSVANSYRELISNTLRSIAPPDNKIKEWLLKTNRNQLLTEKGDNLVPTRRGKFFYIFCGCSSSDRKLAENESKCLNHLYNIFNKPTHSLSPDMSGKLLSNYGKKVINHLKTLLYFYNHR